jgi:hypothetical protein
MTVDSLRIPTTCPWCSSEKAEIDDPDLTNDRFLQGCCPDCERAFEEDRYEEYYSDSDNSNEDDLD